MRYELNKLKLKCWNDALDEYLKYKNRNPGCNWNQWYTLRKVSTAIKEKAKENE